MNLLDRIIAGVAPERALKRAQARRALDVLAHYDAATGGRRTKSWRPSPSDADAAGARRARLAYITRDMIRNTPFATRAQQVIANNVIGDGIIPKIIGTQAQRRRGLDLIERHFDTTAIDADGVQNLYGLQRLAMNCVVESGEVLIRRRMRRASDGLPLPFQIQVLEPDYLDDTKDGTTVSGNIIRDGIEYDFIGRRVAYHLFDEHPGGMPMRTFGLRTQSRRVDASEVLHVYRVDRPGQRRGMPWFANIAINLQDLADHQDAELMRQKIAACFAVFRVSPELAENEITNPMGATIRPGAVYDLSPGEDVRFGQPPGTDGFEEFNRVVLRSVAAGLGLTYEALSGDLSGVNFSSARMGRMEMDRNVSSWQWTMMVPQMCQPLSRWFTEAWMMEAGDPRLADLKIEWTPPHRNLVDPAREIPALREKVRAGFASRQSVVRSLGYDPERLMEEIIQDKERDQSAGLYFDSTAQPTAAAIRQEIEGDND
jgi:lambda family phage portal protein